MNTSLTMDGTTILLTQTGAGQVSNMLQVAKVAI